MKIVQVQTQAEAGGAQRISAMLAEGLRSRGHEVRTVFLYRKTNAFDDDPSVDFITRDIPRSLGARLTAGFGLIAYLRRLEPDAVISFQHYGNVFGTLAGRLAGARRLIANQSGAPLRGGLRGVATVADKVMGTLGLYHHNVVNSAWTEAQFAGYPAAYRARLRRIEHGVARPAAALAKSAARAAFGLPANVPLIVTTGRLHVLKDQVTLVRSLSLVPRAHLAIAGAGPERQPIEREAVRLGLCERVHLVGEVPPARIFDFLAAGDAFAFPTLQETFGLAAVEAALSGLPVVATDLPVLREVLSTEAGDPAALFVPPSEAEAFARALDSVLAEASLAERLTQAAARLAGRYAPERMVDAYEALLGR